ncbi:MAG: hypothetical protein GY872_15175 [Roseibacillus sp.]|nr:hypothetical protein [Roseibacillus sp.]
MPVTSQCWKIYALGGGLGHLHRSLALSRAAIARGHRVDVLANSRLAPHLPWREELGPRGCATMIPSSASPSETSAAVSDWLHTGDCDRLVVDTFPRGLAGELPALLLSVTVPTVLVHRDLNPDYVEQFQLAKAVNRFDLILVPGEDAPFAREAHAQSTDPWLIRDSTELLTPCWAREALGVEAGDDRPVLVVCSTSSEREERFFHELASSLTGRLDSWIVRTASPVPASGQLTIWPLLRLLPGVNGLIGGGGYNLVHEARSTDTPLFAFALPRRYDRQAIRLAQHERVRGSREIIARLGEIRKSLDNPSYPNGVHQAANLIEQSARRS